MASSAMALALLVLLLSADASASWEPIANCDLDPGVACSDDCTKRGHWRWTCEYACLYCGTNSIILPELIASSDSGDAKTIQNSLAPTAAAAPAFGLRKLRL